MLSIIYIYIYISILSSIPQNITKIGMFSTRGADPHGLQPVRPAAPLPLASRHWRWKITIFNGTTHYKWAIFNSYFDITRG